MKSVSVEAVNNLRQNARSVVRELGLLNDAYFEIGVTLAERHLLIELTNSSSPTMGEIGERLLLEKSTISRLIAKAAKKGYVKCVTDSKDKRKRFLQITEKGKETLNAFEPIAFNQTKEALLTLTQEEIEIVHKGIALYAKGLRNSRTLNRAIAEHLTNKQENRNQTEESLAKIISRLKKMGYTLDPFVQEDEKALYEIFKEVVDSGSQFPYEDNSKEEFHRQFFTSTGKVYVCHSLDGKVIGGFYLKTNYSGRSNHIANAAYMIDSASRGQGIGSLLIKASLYLAKDLKYRAIQYNMVLSENANALRLYEKLGFNVAGIIPEGVRNSSGTYQDGYVMHRKLDNL